MSEDDEAIAEYCERIYQIRRTVWKMLSDRGYSVRQADLIETMTTFKKNCTENGIVTDPGKLIIRVPKANNPKNRAIVLFSGKREKFSIDDVKFFFAQVDQEWQSNEMDHATDTLVGVFVIHKNITSFAKKFMVGEHQRRNQGLVDNAPRMNFSFNVFFEVELVVNITEHEIVPRHRLLAADEKRQLLERYMVKDDQLPRILLTDPVAKYLGLRRGDVVEITRDSDTAGRYVTYRICL